MELVSGYWDHADIQSLATPHVLCDPCRKFCSTSQLLSTLPRDYALWEQERKQGDTLTIRDKSQESFSIHNYAELYRCVSAGECHLCAIIWSELSTQVAVKHLIKLKQGEEDGLVLNGVVTGGSKQFINHCILSLEVGNESCKTDILLLVSAEPDAAPVKRQFDAQLAISTASEFTTVLAQTWLQDCLSKHKACANERQSAVWERTLPARLVYLPRDDSPARIVDTINLSQTTPYLTLSHMWGDAIFLKMLSTNMKVLCSSIPLSELSQTHRDSLTICRSLGYQYIWIDSLCIIQDSSSDWKSQSSLMASIYGNSDCTIAAASSASSGCFSLRNPLFQRPCKLVVSDQSSDPEDGVYAYPYHGAAWSSFSNHYYSSLPILQRAWVQQERVLSPRILYFSKNEIHWECCSHQASETWPKGVPNEEHGFDEVYPLKAAFETQLKPYHHWSDDDYHAFVYELWHNGVFREYTSAQLTYEKDRLVALAGIVGVIQQRTKMTYVAGMWRELLPMELLWRNIDRPTPGQKRLEDMPWRAPTWSWASVRGRKRHDIFSLLYRSEELVYISRVIDCTLRPLNTPDPILGEVSGGNLTLTGLLVEASPVDIGEAPRRGLGGTAYLDVDVSQYTKLYYFCIMRTKDSPPYHTSKGLVLARKETQKDAEDKDDTYFRVGIFIGSYNAETGGIFDAVEEREITIC